MGLPVTCRHTEGREGVRGPHMGRAGRACLPPLTPGLGHWGHTQEVHRPGCGGAGGGGGLQHRASPWVLSPSIFFCFVSVSVSEAPTLSLNLSYLCLPLSLAACWLSLRGHPGMHLPVYLFSQASAPCLCSSLLVLTTLRLPGHPLSPRRRREIPKEARSPQGCLGHWEKPVFPGPSQSRNLGPSLDASHAQV